MRKIGILGGTFDPIHIGHIHIAYEALYKLELNEVIFMPSGNPPHKTEKVITDGHIRYDMVREAVKNERCFSVNDYEINRSQLSYTYETLQYFHKRYTEVQWHFITGADCLVDLHKWKNVDAILDNCKFVVFNRGGFSRDEIYTNKKIIEEKYNKEIIYLEIPLIEISSTEIRKKIKDKEKYDYLLPKGVDEYINKNKLYVR